MLIFNKYLYKNKKSKLYFGDRVAVLNDFIYQTGGSTVLRRTKTSPQDSIGKYTVGTHHRLKQKI
jgi:hypothetical protein